jgi:8-oxo-dGTP pyrophosphatase MutT (NUDIX family)
MPLTKKGEEILAKMTSEYGEEKGKEVFYASRNSGKITGVDSAEPETMPSGIEESLAQQDVVTKPGNAQAAGVMLVDADGRALLMRRTGHDHRGQWAFPGGGIEAGETAEAAARRELFEETGFQYDGELMPLTRRKKDGVDFTTFAARVDTFTPTMNNEHDMFKWFSPEEALSPQQSFGVMHPGVSVALHRPAMDELGIAQAMRDGELVSPQRYGKMLLINLRITGTGAAYRNGADQDEYTWRDPSIYMNEEFKERCQGLPVIIDHPKDKTLNSEEYRRRVAGAVMLPYLVEDKQEVWGVSRIHDEASAQALETTVLSTSPAVAFMGATDSGVKARDDKGTLFLIENKPSLLDHLAICDLGVWDKLGPPTGVESVNAAEVLADDFDPSQPRANDGKWTSGAGGISAKKKLDVAWDYAFNSSPSPVTDVASKHGLTVEQVMSIMEEDPEEIEAAAEAEVAALAVAKPAPAAAPAAATPAVERRKNTHAKLREVMTHAYEKADGVEASLAVSKVIKVPPPPTSHDNLSAVREYVTSSSNLNYALRSAKGDLTKLGNSGKKSVGILDSMIKEARDFNIPIKVMRGVPANVVHGLKPGAVFTDHAYSSTSFSKKLATAWSAVRLEITLPKGFKFLSIPSMAKAAPGKVGSCAMSEAEAILPRGCVFKVTKIESGSKPVLHVRAIASSIQSGDTEWMSSKAAKKRTAA